MLVCKDPDDEYTFEKPRWIADLSNGERIYQDDGRPGVHKKAWARLAEYVAEHELTIKHVFLQFRSHYESPLPVDQPGYHFSQSVLAGISGDRIDYFLIGYYDGVNVHISEWEVPALVKVDEFTRKPSECLEGSIIYDRTKRLQPNDKRS